jgi:hypothetical protein
MIGPLNPVRIFASLHSLRQRTSEQRTSEQHTSEQHTSEQRHTTPTFNRMVYALRYLR